MAAHYESKHGIVAIPSEQLYMSFTDLRVFTQSLPAEYRDSVTADYDTLHATVKGFTIGVKVAERRPYSLIRLEDNDAPFHFSATAHFDHAGSGNTDFWLEVDADLNLMMKAMLGSRIKDALDKAVDGLVAVSQGKQPQFPSDLG
ncbi:MAG: hypothetical protein IKZ51_03725 [Bacteroidales bacterium]|nr:hypothetical protein [Bacteroidales bacterium]